MALGPALLTTVRVEARGQLVGERLVVDEAIGLRRAEGPVVEVDRLERTVFQPRDLCADQRGAVLEIFRAALRPLLELPATAGHRQKVPSALLAAGSRARSGMRQRGEKPVVCHGTRCP